MEIIAISAVLGGAVAFAFGWVTTEIKYLRRDVDKVMARLDEAENWQRKE